MSSTPISRVAVLGAGTMGHGIAHVSALAGYQTALYDIDDGKVQAGLSKIKANLAKSVEKGKATQQAMEDALARLSGNVELAEAVRDADLVVEAVPEILELKRKLLGSVAQHVSATCVLGTNTSSLSIANIAEGLPSPERVIGLHFFNPVHIMKLLEIVVGAQTSPGTLATAQAYGASIGKDCIVVKDSPGFATSRLGLVIGLEAIRMVEEGVASPEDIDKAMVLGYGFPMGPLRLSDLVGLDVRLNIADYLSKKLPQGAHFEPPALMRKMVAEGKLGQKSGQGFYTWPAK